MSNVDNEIVIFAVENSDTVYNQPSNPTVFTTSQSYIVTQLTNYHWNNGSGKTPGTIGLKDQNGVIYGLWQATGVAGMNGVQNEYWTTTPNVVIPPGTYTVVDSDPATWSCNSGSGNRGFTNIKGIVNGNGLLRITMSDSSEREYKLTTNEINNFVQWYNRTVGTGNTCYSFDDVIDGSKEYLAFEKIISFKVVPIAQ